MITSQVATYGNRPGTGFVKSLDSNVLTPRGQIKIEKTFQVKSHPNVYAIGDVIDWEEQKQAAKAAKHAQIAAGNIIAQLNGGVPKTNYSGQPELIIITNGKVGCTPLSTLLSLSDPSSRHLQKQGISFMGMLWGITLGNWFSSSMKGKELMVGMARKGYGLAK